MHTENDINTKTVILEKLKQSGLKLTPQRLAIVEFLEGNTTHPAAEDVYNAVKTDYPTISLATIYNTMDTLVKIGVVQEILINNDKRHFDPDITNHFHALCRKCGGITDVFEPFTKEAAEIRNKVSGFKVESTSIDFYGICEGCAREN